MPKETASYIIKANYTGIVPEDAVLPVPAHPVRGHEAEALLAVGEGDSNGQGTRKTAKVEQDLHQHRTHDE